MPAILYLATLTGLVAVILYAADAPHMVVWVLVLAVVILGTIGALA